jgi:hypothetical protein
MALVLRLRPGDDFFVAKERVTVGALLGGPRFRLEVESSGRAYEITDSESVEMREVRDVFFSSGGRVQAGLCRLAIEAPREISIIRGAVARGETGGGDGYTPRQSRAGSRVERVDPGRRFAEKQLAAPPKRRTYDL